MFKINEINLQNDLLLFSNMESYISDNIDNTVLLDSYNKIIQYMFVNEEIYIKTIYGEFKTSKYNIENFRNEKVVYRLDINEDMSFLYGGYELVDNNDTIYRYDMNGNLFGTYKSNRFNNKEFNIDYVRSDPNNSVLKIYYYRIFPFDKDRFVNFIKKNKNIIIDYIILEERIDELISNITNQYFIFKYSDEENCFSLYAFQ